MDFSLQGKATQRNYQNQRQRPHFNPVTGEQLYISTSRVQQQKEVKPENEYGVPSLNLNYLKDDDKKSTAVFDLADYALDTPNSASTAGSWRTQKSGKKYPVESTKGKLHSSRCIVRPDGVPELRLDDGIPESHRRPEKQQTAWDKDPVPVTLSQPSARYKQMYQQYSEEMKQSYRDHVNISQPGVGNIGAKPTSPSKTEIQQERNGETDDKVQHQNDGTLHNNATLQHSTNIKQQKKKDAEDLFEKNKKLKLVETVMIDQLSRTVISDPEQNDLQADRHNSSQKSRASNRLLHDSKVSTRATATENLLSRRVRFGARILTQNGHDALRELTGFFFHFDKTLTVYEFRQFGKSAKALPFIYRGQYLHINGPHQGFPYSLSDIYVGANLKIPTKGQLALTESLAGNSWITLRITDVDEIEKKAVLALIDSEDDRLHVPRELDIDNREYLRRIQGCVQKQIHKRGIRTITGLGRYYRKLDQYNTGILDQYDLEKGLQTFHINLDTEQLEQVFEILDPEGYKTLEYKEYMRGVLGEMNETRKMLVRKAFLKLDSSKQGFVHLNEVKKFFNAGADYRTAAADGGDSRMSALQAFVDAVRDNDKQEQISYLQFEEYYEGLSVSVPSDESFITILCKTWTI